MIQAGTLANALNSSLMRNDLLDASTRKLEQAAKGPLNATSAKMVATEFESLFISQMLEHMMGGDSLGESLFGNQETDEIYKSMMVDEYAKAIVKGGGIGIAKNIEQTLIERSRAQSELLKTQEVAYEPAV